MNIWITGGTGFIGSRLSELLLDRGDAVTAIGRRPEFDGIRHERFRYVSADTTEEGSWQEGIAAADAVVNLAGSSIFTYWTDAAKQKIYESRVATTRNVAAAVTTDPERQTVLVSTSAVGYYGDRGDELLYEDAAAGEGFLSDVAVAWENAALAAEKKGVRVVITRFGIVMGKDGGALKQMIPPFKLGMGGPLGDGRQWFPWIHIDDLLSGIVYALTEKELRGPVNLTSPQPVQNRSFVKALARVLRRPAFVRVPGCVLRKTMGEFGEVLLSSQRVLPGKLQDAGFRFEHPEVGPALKHLVRGR